MRASDLETTLPLVDRNTTALEAARLIAADRLGGLVVASDSGIPIAVVSAVDVLALVTPAYVLDDMSLAGVFDEQGAEEIWTDVDEHVIGDLLDDVGARVREILIVDADSTLVELAARMVDARAQIALVRHAPGSDPRFVTLPDVMDAILKFVSPQQGPGA